MRLKMFIQKNIYSMKTKQTYTIIGSYSRRD